MKIQSERLSVDGRLRKIRNLKMPGLSFWYAAVSGKKHVTCYEHGS